jgi:phosphate transport system substrate-binding protein
MGAMLRRQALALFPALLAGCHTRDRSNLGLQGPRVDLRGAGASLPAAAWAEWGEQYGLVDPLVGLTYTASSSSAAARYVQLEGGDFGASDTGLEPGDKAKGDLLALPMVMTSVAVIANLPSLRSGAQLAMSGDTLARILIGELGTWDAGALKADNKSLTLPSTPIRVVMRGESSGTKGLMSEYLNRKNRGWSQLIGISSTLDKLSHPRLDRVKGTEAVVSLVRAVEGSMAFVSYSEAVASRLPIVALYNQSGRAIRPTLGSTSDARPGPDGSLLDAPGEATYPLVALSYAIVPARSRSTERGQVLARFLQWSISEGQRFSTRLGFAALPIEIALQSEGKLRSLKGPDGQALLA